MSNTFANTITANSTWQNVATTYTAAANTAAWVQNRGPKNVLVAFSSSASAPNDGGEMLMTNGKTTGTAQYVWIKSLGDASKISIGLV